MATQQLFSFLDDPSAAQQPAETAVLSARARKLPAQGQKLPAQGQKTNPPSDVDSLLKAKGWPAAPEKPAPEKLALDTSAMSPPIDSTPPSRETVLQGLRSKVGCISTPRQKTDAVFSTGCEAIDDWLPAGGLAPCTLTDWIAAHESTAAGSLAMLAAADRLRQVPNRPLVIVDCDGSFYPPAAVALGVPVERMILLRPPNRGDAIWAIDQSLRSGAVAAVWATLPTRMDDRDARRLQLAAETGNTPGLLVRGFHDRGKPGFSEIQFYVSENRRHENRQHHARQQSTASRRHPVAARSDFVAARSDFETISVTLDRVRGGVTGRQANVLIDDQANLRVLPSNETTRHETAARHLASQLANPTSAKRVAAKRSTA